MGPLKAPVGNTSKLLNVKSRNVKTGKRVAKSGDMADISLAPKNNAFKPALAGTIDISQIPLNIRKTDSKFESPANKFCGKSDILLYERSISLSSNELRSKASGSVIKPFEDKSNNCRFLNESKTLAGISCSSAS